MLHRMTALGRYMSHAVRVYKLFNLNLEKVCQLRGWEKKSSIQCLNLQVTSLEQDVNEDKVALLFNFGASSVQFSSVQFSHSVASHSLRPYDQASLSITNFRSLLKLVPIKSVMPSSHLNLCRPLLLLPPIPPSIRIFSSESTLRMRWPEYWSFSSSISPSNEHSGLISFRMDWLDLLAVQGTLKSLLQHHSLKASIFRLSAFFTVQLSHPYMTTGKKNSLDQTDLCWPLNTN